MEQIISYLINTFGPFAVVIFVIGGASWLFIKELRKSNESLINKQHEYNKELTSGISDSITKLSEKLTDDLRGQNKQLIDYLLSQDVNKIALHNKNLLDRRNITSEVNTLISNLCIELGGLRVCVIEFHNSLFNQTGFPFLKYTVTYEKITKGCKTIQQNYQGSQFSSISTISEYVLQSHDHIYELHSHDEIDEIVPIMLYDGRTNVNAVLFKGLFDNEDNDLIGLLCIEFADKIPENYNKTSIISTARTIGELISLTNEMKEENNTNGR